MYSAWCKYIMTAVDPFYGHNYRLLSTSISDPERRPIDYCRMKYVVLPASASVWMSKFYLKYNVNINICSIELKWDGKITKICYDNEMR